jgi:DNA repair protein RadC
VASRHDKLIARALVALESRVRKPGPALATQATCANWFRLKLAGHEHEVFAAAWLDTHHRLIDFEEVARGTFDSTSVSVREVVKSALRHNAAAVVFAHNHPSGGIAPSGSDIDLTEALAEGLALVDVRVLDHFIVTAHHRPVSLRQVLDRVTGGARSGPVRRAKGREKGV